MAKMSTEIQIIHHALWSDNNLEKNAELRTGRGCSAASVKKLV